MRLNDRTRRRRVICPEITIDSNDESCGWCVYAAYGDGKFCVLFRERICEEGLRDQHRCEACLKSEVTE